MTYCEAEFDKADDKKKELELSISDIEKAMDEAKESIETFEAEIKALEEGIIKLDREVAEATQQRKEEHADFEAQMANDGAVIQIIGVAKNRLNKFYNPKLYKPPPKRELKWPMTVPSSRSLELPRTDSTNFTTPNCISHHQNVSSVRKSGSL